MQCQCTIYLNTVKIIEKQHAVCGVIIEMNQNDTDDNEINHSIINSKSFDSKANFIGSVTHNNLTKNDVKIVLPLKYFRNFWRSLNMPLINCEVELILTWFKNCVLISKSTRDADYEEPIDRKIEKNVPVVTLSKENDVKLLEQLKTGFNRI